MSEHSEKKHYSRILLKLSGEALAGSESQVFDPKIITAVAHEVSEARDSGTQVALVIGGGNIFRGGLGESLGMDRVIGDQMGMLATVINALAMKEAILSNGGKARVMTSIHMHPVGEHYNSHKAIETMVNGEIVIVAGGTGNPYFTTDTAAALRAVELKADLLIKATKVDGVYDKDPVLHSDAKKIDKISYLDVIQKKLRVMDLTAISLCMDNMLPIVVCSMAENGTIKRVTEGEIIGTMVS